MPITSFWKPKVSPRYNPATKTWTAALPALLAGGQKKTATNPYSGLIAEYLNQMRANSAAGSIADAASRDEAIRRYIISYGEVPDFAQMGISDQTKGFLGGAINDKVRALAEQNTKEGLSVKARMLAANLKEQRKIPAVLAGRGMLRSGQTGSDLADQAMQYKQATFDTLNEMLGGIQGTVSQYLEAERQRQEALAQAEMDTAWKAYGDWGGEDTSGGGPFGGGSSGVRGKGGVTGTSKRFVPTSKQLKKGTNLSKKTRNRMRAGRM